MSIKEHLSPDGQVLWYDVSAGKVQGRRIRKRFTVGRARIGDAAVRRARGLKSTSTPSEHALAAADLWLERKQDQLAKARYEVAAVPTHKLPEIIRALEML